MLQAGTGQIDITPKLGCHICGHFTDRIAEDIHDPLFAKAVVLTDGDTTLAIAVCDVIAVPADLVDAAKCRIAEQVGIAPDHVLIMGTHTHTGPATIGALGTPTEEGYAEWAAPRVADAVALAHRRLQPVQMACAVGDCSAEVHNRRWHMQDGSVRMNPGYLNPDAIRPAGPTDPALNVLILRTPEREPVAVLANLGLHYVGTGAGTTISADYFGMFSSALQRIAGGRFLVAMMNGCFGDVNNCDFSKAARTSPHPFHQIERVGNVVAAETWRVWNSLREEEFTDDVKLGAQLVKIPFAARTATEEEMAAARKLYAEGEDHTDVEWLYARELVLMEELPDEWEVPISALRIGDLGIVGLPGEVFSQIGLDIKARSPFRFNMNLGLANDSVGYVATDQALNEGSYETRLCRHVRAPKGTALLWTNTAAALLNELAG